MGQFVPTVFPGGVTNADADSFGARVPMPWPAQYYTFFDDFDRFVQDMATTPVAYGDWLVTIIDAGAGTTSGVIDDVANGVLLITTAGNEDDGLMAQWQGGNAASVAETFTFVANKRVWFACRFQMSDVTQSDFICGLAIADTTPLDAADGVFFLKVDGSAVLTLQEKIATPLTASANLVTLVAATWYDVAFEYNGVDAITAYLKDSTSGVWNAVGSVGVTALPTTELAVTFGFQNGEAAAKTCQIDYIFAAKER
jgi:hypothetical protein